MDTVNKTFQEIAKEASQSKVVIDGDAFRIAFNTLIYNGNDKFVKIVNNPKLPLLIIKNYDLFIKKLSIYTKLCLEKGGKLPNFVNSRDKNNLKFIISYLFVNATVNDFSNPMGLLDRNISFLEDTTVEVGEKLDISKLDNLLESTIEIKVEKQSVFMETPRKVTIKLKNEYSEQYCLPAISYGISEINNKKICYVYSILNSNRQQTKTKYIKKLSRIFYKLNKGVVNLESIEYKNYLEDKEEYYPENISDVSLPAIISISTFMLFMKSKGIDTFIAVPYLPLRYLSRDLSLEDISDNIKIAEFSNRNDLIQKNITDKFIRTFRRLEYHLPELSIKSLPFEIDENLHMSINEENIISNNEILNEISEKILNNTSKLKRH